MVPILSQIQMVSNFRAFYRMNEKSNTEAMENFLSLRMYCIDTGAIAFMSCSWGKTYFKLALNLRIKPSFGIKKFSIATVVSINEGIFE